MASSSGSPNLRSWRNSTLAVLFLSAGHLQWWEGWAYTGMTLFVLVLSRSLILLKNPDMARERAEAGQKKDVKAWDKIIVPLIAVYGPLVSWIIAGLDERFSWTPDLPDYIQVIALGVMFLGNMIATWAMVSIGSFRPMSVSRLIAAIPLSVLVRTKW